MEVGASYNHETVLMDGVVFRDCSFQACRLIFSGSRAPVFEYCRFADCEWVFEGFAAEALSCLTAMWGAGARQAVQTMVERVVRSERADSPVLLSLGAR